MKFVLGKKPKKRRQVAGRIDFNHGELSNPGVAAAKILKRTREAESACDRRGQCHRSQIIFATAAAEPLLQIDIGDFVGRQFPLLDQLRPQHRFIDEPVPATHWANLQARRRLIHCAARSFG